MERAGLPRLSPRRSSVEAKMHSTSCMVRKSSTVTAWPAVALLWSWRERWRDESREAGHTAPSSCHLLPEPEYHPPPQL
uniref:Uncharacterized protein n=1 Tax=Rattus norvegicus TaxID=10116 RepID=A0ABK0LB30_RAT